MIAGVSAAWSINRAAGIAALELSSATIVVGLMQSGRRMKLKLPAVERHALHEALSIAVLVVIAIHGLAFALDPFFHSGIVGALVPFASPYRPLSVAVGQVAGYGIVALSLSFYLRRRIGTQRWRVAHRFIAVFWGLGVLHTLLTGSEVGRSWFLLATIPPVLVALFLLLQRADERSRIRAADREPSARPAARDGSAHGRAGPIRTGPDASVAGR